MSAAGAGVQGGRWQKPFPCLRVYQAVTIQPLQENLVGVFLTLGHILQWKIHFFHFYMNAFLWIFSSHLQVYDIYLNFSCI